MREEGIPWKKMREVLALTFSHAVVGYQKNIVAGECVALLRKLGGLMGEKAELGGNDQLDLVKKELESFKQSLAGEKEQRETLEKELAEHRRRIEEEKQVLEQNSRELMKKLEEQKKLNQEESNKTKNLEKQLEAIKRDSEEAKRLREELRINEQKIKEGQQLQQSLYQQVEGKKAENKKVLQDMMEKSKILESRAQELRDAELQVQKLAEENAKFRQECFAIQKKLSEKQREESELQKLLDRHKQQNQVSTRESQEKERELQERKKEIEELQMQLEIREREEQERRVLVSSQHARSHEQLIQARILQYLEENPGSPLSLLASSSVPSQSQISSSLVSSSLDYVSCVLSPIRNRLNTALYGEIAWTGKNIVTNPCEILERRGSSKDSPVWRAVQNKEHVALKKISLPAYKYRSPVPSPEPKQVGDENENPENVEAVVPEERKKEFTIGREAIEEELEINFSFYSAFREPFLLSRLSHPNIIDYRGILRRESNSFYFSMSYMDCDSDYFSRRGFTLLQIQHIAYRVLGAIHYLHSAGIVHRDIQPTSILIAASDRDDPKVKVASRKLFGVKLASFGNARAIHSISATREKLPNPAANMWCWAPEVAVLEETGYYISKRFDWRKCDVWSLGCTLATMMRCGEPLFRAKTASNHLAEILSIRELRPRDMNTVECEDFPIKSKWVDRDITLKDLITDIPDSVKRLQIESPVLSGKEDLPVKAVDFLLKMLAFDQSNRLSTESLLNHSFFEKIVKQATVESRSNGIDVSDDNLIVFALECGALENSS
eukprot:TRINITY_DN4105_c0_g1_i4.p1 TRINITY_DN4105_c0_g1~~TRINITY_DN4105_c0_g1_i4.p1  ORF type:complete len:782 (-),score=185.36 TRINITY_DN4105_c0_g1_i4:93-2438(-)